VEKKRYLVAALGLVAGLGAAVLLYFRNPHVPGAYPPCPFHYLTGLWCPGCGVTRGIHDVMHGRFLEGLLQNPLLMLFLPFAVIWGGRAAWRLFVDPTAAPIVLKDKWIKVGLIVVLIYGILRNLPWWPFTILAPGG